MIPTSALVELPSGYDDLDDEDRALARALTPGSPEFWHFLEWDWVERKRHPVPAILREAILTLGVPAWVGPCLEEIVGAPRPKGPLYFSEVRFPTESADDPIADFWRLLQRDWAKGLRPDPPSLKYVLVLMGLPPELGEYLELRLRGQGRPSHRPPMSSVGVSSTEEDLLGGRKPAILPTLKKYLAYLVWKWKQWHRGDLEARKHTGNAFEEAKHTVSERYGVSEGALHKYYYPGPNLRRGSDDS